MDEQQARERIVEAVLFLEEKGLNHGSAGNVSLRLGDHLLITPTGGRGSWLKPKDIVRLSLDGTVQGDGIPSSEWRFHTGILGRRPEAQAVVHTHADCCVALSCLRKPIPAFHYMVASFGGNAIPVSRYEPFGSKALAEAAVEAIEGHYACLLANHGMIVTGRSLQHALDLTVKLETLARQYILACQAGDPVMLSDEDMVEVHRRYGNYGTAAMPE
ncbi:class II aldolase/adducin family protein [Tianweitania sediminis]|jgi:L-fuculose-phosphate aldolase|uniref:Class II aldolase/adducin family protein n=1 Tax=Tianweitania sediminis TaxID=1502156 RepID=A0A8J7ULA1_9HYPH|nr:class II aldolase/adducin family protein [Tianweitania sediminis]MBP0440730.1 class II aldolase/adducin family protein [Tianweitania sediminis]HEV7416408.1 class II aldolase/adducin family protein [Tianweitania sediminis]